ncbi:TniB family NTP-binding protein [Roseomonas mucosa]|uniref:TniB family NTP-binding protein n=1 Tax=Roseomonas mucosa TaxID=207340 RepID=UPI001D2C6986|nr:TniB family NTP-binding protein [Roseomonas mucosa]MBS5905024.1 TniB family NTP-binding protein [Acetobacteraceae bacterium]MDT8312745.1 TniB family NTP-binding protein [Roseomonas mucosa]MDT8351167.1 TniB family NTP-binding protein [Roseomonas mucosa]MDT8360102.1 TniB family NTP-binding protein [Roseomonas mucosa]
MVDQKELRRLRVAVDGLKTIFLSSGFLKEVNRDIGMLYDREHKEGEAALMVLRGATRSGKSQILNNFMDEHPDEPRAIRGPNGEVADRKSALYLKLPNTSDKNVAEAWLAELLGIPDSQVRGLDRRGFDIKGEIDAVSQMVDNKIALLDEVHQAVHRRNDDKVATMAEFLKDICNKGTFSIVLAGNERMMRLLDANDELAGRVLIEHEIKPMDWDVARDRDESKAILEQWDNHLRDSVFGVTSGLTERRVAWALHAASRGYRGIAANIVESAAKTAAYDMLLGTARCITFEHLAKAFSRIPFYRAAPKAFEVAAPPEPKPKPKPDPGSESELHPESESESEAESEADKEGDQEAETDASDSGSTLTAADAMLAVREGAVGPEAANAPTMLRGRTRRSDRHRNFRP